MALEWLSLDSTNRIWMSDIPRTMPPVAFGAMRGHVCRHLGEGRFFARSCQA